MADETRPLTPDEVTAILDGEGVITEEGVRLIQAFRECQETMQRFIDALALLPPEALNE